MSEAEHIDISGQQKSGMDNKSTHQTLEGVQLQPVQNTGNTSEKEHQSDPIALQTKSLQESSRIFDFDTTVSFEEHLSDSGSIVSKTVEYQNATVVDGQCQLAERTNFVSQSVIDEKDCFSINELLLTDYPPGFEVHPSVAEEKECSGIKETITDYPPGFEINTLHDVSSKPGHSNTVSSDLAEVEQLGNSSGMEYNTLGQSSVGVGHSKHSALVEEDRPATGFDDASKDVVDHYEWSPCPRLSLDSSEVFYEYHHPTIVECKHFKQSIEGIEGREPNMGSSSSDTRFLQELVLYAASAALSCLVLFAGLKHLDPNREASKKAHEQKKEIARRLGRPFIQTNPYEATVLLL